MDCWGRGELLYLEMAHIQWHMHPSGRIKMCPQQNTPRDCFTSPRQINVLEPEPGTRQMLLGG